MPIDPQRALEGYLRALTYDADDSGPAPGPGRPATTAKAEPEPEPALAGDKAPAPGAAPAKAPVPAPEQVPTATRPAGLLLRLLSLRRGPAAAERTRRA
ncbi:hypothetical protein [Streptomyces rimosus]|uniref:hypothetical protein n=1 Tax=Streptomyces rimosus TaxID=1927 RepID=UPI0004C6FF51|nr:hypothetical protein [Streptomyces rimosus]